MQFLHFGILLSASSDTYDSFLKLLTPKKKNDDGPYAVTFQASQNPVILKLFIPCTLIALILFFK